MFSDLTRILFWFILAILARRLSQPPPEPSARKKPPPSLAQTERLLRRRFSRITLHPTYGPSLWHTFWRTGQVYFGLVPLLSSWGGYTFTLRHPAPYHPTPPSLYRAPASLALSGTYDPRARQGTLTILNRPPGSLVLWKVLPGLPAALPLALLEPERIPLSYRSSEEIYAIRRFLRALLSLLELTPVPEIEIIAMQGILEHLATTAWAQRPENQPVIAFYLALARIRFLRIDHEAYGLGEIWEPLAPYLQPSLVMGIAPSQHETLKQRDPQLLALMYNLRVYSYSIEALGLTTRNALEDLDRALALQPAYPGFYWLNKGGFICRWRDFTQALKAYKRAMETPAALPFAAYARAVLYYHLRDVAQARREIILGWPTWKKDYPELLEIIADLIRRLDPDFPLKA